MGSTRPSVASRRLARYNSWSPEALLFNSWGSEGLTLKLVGVRRPRFCDPVEDQEPAGEPSSSSIRWSSPSRAGLTATAVPLRSTSTVKGIASTPHFTATGWLAPRVLGSLEITVVQGSGCNDRNCWRR